MTPLESMLARIHQWERDLHRTTRQGASVETVEVLRSRMRSELNVDLPDDYRQFLLLSDGIDWNGTVFYASARVSPGIDDLVDANVDIRDVLDIDSILALGESGMDLYVFDLGTHSYNIVDRVDAAPFESYSSFEELFVPVMASRQLRSDTA